MLVNRRALRADSRLGPNTRLTSPPAHIGPHSVVVPARVSRRTRRAMPSTTPHVRSRRARARASRRALALAAFACSLARVPIASGAEAAGDEPATECAASGADALLHDADVPSPADSAASARPRRLVAVPDLHGDLAHARRSLQLAGVLAPDDASDPDAWIAGADAHLVQTGDILDRGENSIDVMDLLARLSERAAAGGGEVTALLGNHELMTLQGDLSYVAREEIVRLGRENLDANKLGGEEMGTGYGLRAYWTAGQMRWTKLFRSDGTQGARLRRERTLLALAGDGACATLFSHAGLRARHLEAHGGTVDSVNAAARVAVAGDDGRRVLRSHDLFDGESPLWNRFYGVNEDEAAVCAELDVVLRAVGARRMVVGHTVQAKGMRTRCGGRLHLIDVGVSEKYVGRGAAWSCESDVGGSATVRAHYDGKTVVLESGGEDDAMSGRPWWSVVGSVVGV